VTKFLLSLQCRPLSHGKSVWPFLNVGPGLLDTRHYAENESVVFNTDLQYVRQRTLICNYRPMRIRVYVSFILIYW